jgi:UPF0042 nucleotide-binding protein
MPSSASETVAAKPRLVLITGLSGSGKSTVGKCFEDLGYYCVDNLPLPLLRSFLADPLVEGHHRIAVVTDVRAPGFAGEFPRLFDEIDRDLVHPILLFLEASDEVLVRRFSETRRPHPLAGKRPVIEGIRAERQLMTEVRARADRLFDSSDWSIHELRAHIYQDFGGDSDRRPGLVVSLVSFGYKHGIPAGTDLLFDVRFLPNPYFVPGLRERTGQDDDVQGYLDGQTEFQEVIDRFADLLLYLLPRYAGELRSYLSVGIGCTGGRHRSVATVERLRARLEEAGWKARASHRDIER